MWPDPRPLHLERVADGVLGVEIPLHRPREEALPVLLADVAELHHRTFRRFQITDSLRGDQDPFVYQTSPQQYSDEPSASPQITWAMPVEPTAIPK
jgi:hypothetical protein